MFIHNRTDGKDNDPHLKSATAFLFTSVLMAAAMIFGGVSTTLQPLYAHLPRTNQIIARIVEQVAEDPSRIVSQSIAQLAHQQAAGKDVSQTIAQIAEQVTQGGDISQAITQLAEQTVGEP